MIALYLVQLGEIKSRAHRIGRTIQWPGDDRLWTWDGSQWLGIRADDGFDGGDAWEGAEGLG